MGSIVDLAMRRFSELFGSQQPVDRVRGQQIPRQGPTLDYLGAYFLCPSSSISLPKPYIHIPDSIFATCLAEEAFTSENWIVRIYQVKKEDPLGRDLKTANAFAHGKKRKRTKPPVRRRSA